MATAKRTTAKKIQSTRNYRLFKRSSENRVTDITKHKKLQKSMEKYGFLPSFPIVVHRNGDQHLIVKEGQHRLAIAEMLGLPVHYVEEEIDFDIATINSTAKTWVIRDYAQKFAANGLKDYQEGLDFAEQHRLPIAIAFGLLAGTAYPRNIYDAFVRGAYAIKDREYANIVAGTYGQMINLSGQIRSVRFLEACMYACRVPEFDSKRLLQNASRCREKLVSYSTRDAYLALLEEVYNFGRSKLFGLKVAAMNAMKERSAVSQAIAKKAAKKSTK